MKIAVSGTECIYWLPRTAQLNIFNKKLHLNHS